RLLARQHRWGCLQVADRKENLVLPVGTQVVTLIDLRSLSGEVLYPLNSVGVIVVAESELEVPYSVRFPDGGAAQFTQDQLVARKHFQRHVSAGLHQARSNDTDLNQYIIYRCVVGSTAYGLDTENSVVDRR